MKLMESKIKNFFLRFSKLKKPAVLAAVLFSVVLGLTLPLQPAHAFVQLIGLWVATCVISLAMQVVLTISILIMGLASLILWWVLSPYFIDIPYTALIHRGMPTIVGVGWPIVRDFANMFFIIILVVIGLATALRISEYQAKKALPKLVIIALLINFTPVMCGLIIDASNILMNFFLEELTGFKMLGNQFSAQGSLILQSLVGCVNPLNAVSALGKTIVMIIFNLVAAFIFFMYALLFIMRYVMIWMLVILSPFAFFTLLLAPGTRKTLNLGLLDWDQWWNQFVQWCIIGITGAFFLYLGEQLMVIFQRETFNITAVATAGGGGWLTMDFVEFVGEMLQYLVVLAFLIVGFFSATSTSAMGAGFVTGWFKEKGTGIARGAGKIAGGLAKAGASAAALRYLGRPAEAVAKRMEGTKAPWEGRKGWRGMVSWGLRPGAALTRIAGAQLERAPAAMKEKMGAWIGQAEGALDNKSAKTQAAEFAEGYMRAKATGIGWDKAIGAIRAAIKNGNLGDVKDYLKEKGIIKEDKDLEGIVQRVGTEAAKYGKQKEILQTGYFKDEDIVGKEGEEEKGLVRKARLTPADLEAYGLTVSEEDKKRFAETQVGRDNPIYTKIMSKLKRDQMGNVSKPIALKDEDFIEILHKFGTGAQVGGLEAIHGREFIDRFRESMLIRQKANPDWYKDNNSKMHKYLTSSPARGLGVGLEDKKDVNREYEKIKASKTPEEQAKMDRRVEELQAGVAPREEVSEEEKDERLKERLVEEWPKTEKGMSQDVREKIEEGEGMIAQIKDQEAKIKSLESAIGEWRDSLSSLEESIKKTEEQIASGRLTGPALTRANEELAKFRVGMGNFESVRGEMEAKEAKIEPAKVAVGQLRDKLLEMYRTSIEPIQEVEKVTKEAEQKLKEVKEKTKRARKKKI